MEYTPATALRTLTRPIPPPAGCGGERPNATEARRYIGEAIDTLATFLRVCTADLCAEGEYQEGEAIAALDTAHNFLAAARAAVRLGGDE